MTTEGVAILDDGGAEVGQVGGMFRFGGGNIFGLLETLGFTQEDRDMAAELIAGEEECRRPSSARCPSRLAFQQPFQELDLLLDPAHPVLECSQPVHLTL